MKKLLCCTYNPHKNIIHVHLENLEKSPTLYPLSYENHIIMGDFNVAPENSYIKLFWDNFDMTNIMEPTCFKSPENPYSIDLILTNSIDLIRTNWSRSFDNSCAIETGLSEYS